MGHPGALSHCWAHRCSSLPLRPQFHPLALEVIITNLKVAWILVPAPLPQASPNTWVNMPSPCLPKPSVLQ